MSGQFSKLQQRMLICDSVWSQTSGEDHELTAEANDSSSLQKELYQLAINNSSGGGVSTLYSTISPSSAVYQVLLNLQPCKAFEGLLWPASCTRKHHMHLESSSAQTAVRHTTVAGVCAAAKISTTTGQVIVGGVSGGSGGGGGGSAAAASGGAAQAAAPAAEEKKEEEEEEEDEVRLSIIVVVLQLHVRVCCLQHGDLHSGGKAHMCLGLLCWM